MDKAKLPIILIGIGIFTILISGIPEKLSFQAIGDTLTGVIFVVVGTITYIKIKKTRENKQ